MEIKVNEFVRIKNGAIRKIIKINEGKEKTIFGKYRLDKPYNNCFSVAQNKIVKHSNNIIDLIECGDYVNGMKVCKINEPSLANDYKRIVYCNEDEGLYEGIFTNDEIKSIVTKQQMEAIQYVVE